MSRPALEEERDDDDDDEDIPVKDDHVENVSFDEEADSEDPGSLALSSATVKENNSRPDPGDDDRTSMPKMQATLRPVDVTPLVKAVSPESPSTR